MEINKFLYLLLFFATLFLFYNENIDQDLKKSNQKPLVVFEESIMYKINDKTVDEIIESKKALLFKDKEELFNGIVVKKIDNEENGEKVNTVSADHIVKKKNDLYLKGNVNLQSDQQLTLKTDALKYDMKNKIAKSNSEFSALVNDDKLEGKGFYVDSKKNYIEAKKVHFKIDLKGIDEKE